MDGDKMVEGIITGSGKGLITQVLGPVVDVEFSPGDLPEIFTALTVTNLSLIHI